MREAVGSEIDRLAADAGRKLVAGGAAEAELARIGALQAVRAALPAKRPPRGLPILVGLACLLALSLGATLRVPSTRLRLDVTANAVTFRPADTLGWNGAWSLDPALVRLAGFPLIDLPPEAGTLPEAARRGPLDISAPGGTISLSRLTFAPGGLVSFSRDRTGGAIEIVPRGETMAGDLDANGTITVRVGPPPGIVLPALRYDPGTTPARFGFRSAGRPATPPVLRITPRAALALSDIGVSGLGFFEERGEGGEPGHFVSRIVGGTVLLADTGERITLAAGEALGLSSAEGVMRDFYATPDGLYVRFEGSADATLGSGAFARHLNPTWLTFLFHRERLAFFWGVLILLIGVGWSARRLLGGPPA